MARKPFSPELSGKLAKFYVLTGASAAPWAAIPNVGESVRGFRAEVQGTKGILYLYGPIDSCDWFDDVVSSSAVKRWLDENQNVAEIEVHINSPGGSVFEGIAIYQMLVQRSAKKTCIIDAVAASAASAVAMAGDEILMPASSVMMVHGVATITRGGIRAHEDAIVALQVASEALREIYIARTGKTAEQVDAMMSRDTWLTAKQAVEQGFADRVIPAKSVKPPLAPSAFALMYPHSDARQIAACFAGETPAPGIAEDPSTDAAAAAQRPAAAKESPMHILFAKLGATDEASAVTAVEALNTHSTILVRIFEIAGATPADIEGKLLAWKQAAERLPAVEQELSGRVAADIEREKRDLIAQAKRERKITTAAEETWAASMSVEVLRAWVPVAAPKVPTTPINPPDFNRGKGSVAHRWNGKPYAELSNMEKDQLSRESPDLFEAMRADHEKYTRR